MTHNQGSSREPDPELADVVRLLDEVAAQEARDMQAAKELEHAPGEHQVERILRSAWETTAPPRRSPAWLGLLTLTAVAAAVLAVVWMRGAESPSGDGPHDSFLSTEEFGVLQPPAQAARWDRIEWRGPLDGVYRLQVFSASDELIYVPADNVRGTSHEPPVEVTARWPAKIRIEISMRQKDGTWISAGSRECELRP